MKRILPVLLLLILSLGCVNTATVATVCPVETDPVVTISLPEPAIEVPQIQNTPVLRDPTRAEAEKFLSYYADKSTYAAIGNNCEQFAYRFQATGRAKGYRTAVVFIHFTEAIQGGGGHVINAFNIPGEGMMYIEPNGVVEVILDNRGEVQKSNGRVIFSFTMSEKMTEVF